MSRRVTPKPRGDSPGGPSRHGGRMPRGDDVSSPPKAGYYADHVDADEALRRVRDGTLLAGALRINSRRRTDAYVLVAGVGVDVLIEGEKDRNRCLEGDVCAVELLQRDAWVERRGPAGAAVGGTPVIDVATARRAGSTAPPLALRSGAASAPDLAPSLPAADAAALTAQLYGHADRQCAVPSSGNADTADGSDEAAAGARPRATTLPPAVAAAVACDANRAAVRATAALTRGGTLQPRGRIVALLLAVHPRTAVGTLRPPDEGPDAMECAVRDSHGFVLLRPLDPRVPFIVIPRHEAPAEFLARPASASTRLFKAAISRWTAASRFPLGHLTGGLGEAGEIASETAALLAEAGVDDAPFSDAVLECLAPFEAGCISTAAGEAAAAAGGGGGGLAPPAPRVWSIPAAELAVRKDLRGERIFTVDPWNAKDLDDALSIRRLEPAPDAPAPLDPRDAVYEVRDSMRDAVYEVGVHIADVSYFLHEGTALDAMAARRATSVYLVQRVIPMLPPLLCEELCSLNPGVDRLAFSVVWRMRGDGTLVLGDTEAGGAAARPWFGRTVIRSAAKLDYGTAQRMIDGTISEEAASCNALSDELWALNRRPTAGDGGATAAEAAIGIVRDMRTMHAVAMARRRKRFQAGALALHKEKLTFTCDAAGNPTAVATYPVRDSNRVIEEFMLLANFLVASAIADGAGGIALLRRHPPILVGRGSDLVTTLAAELGLEFDLSSAGAIHNSLLRAFEVDPVAARVLEALVTKPMKPAAYFAAGSIPDRADWAHYALAMPTYTHFTSPIRRYADVVVHRLLDAVIRGAEAVAALPLTVADVAAQADICNERKLAAKDAQERSDEVFLCVYLARVGGAEVDAVVCDIGGGDKAFSILIPQWGLERRVSLDRCGWVGSVDAASRALHIEARPPQPIDGSADGSGGAASASAAAGGHQRGGAAAPHRHLRGRLQLNNTVRRKIGKWLKRHPDEQARLDAGKTTMEELLARLEAITMPAPAGSGGGGGGDDSATAGGAATGAAPALNTAGGRGGGAAIGSGETGDALEASDDEEEDGAVPGTGGGAGLRGTAGGGSALPPHSDAPDGEATRPSVAPLDDAEHAAGASPAIHPAPHPGDETVADAPLPPAAVAAATCALPPGGVTLRHLSRLRVRLVAIMGRVPIDIDVVVLEVFP